MKRPKRVSKHISETASFKIFSSKIPDHWLIREISERDYGIDCYIELVNRANELSGKLISIQLKAKDKIKWTKKDSTKWKLSGVKISTTNYWYTFAVPTFICVIDISTKEVFFQNVKQYVKSNFTEYLKQKSFSYVIDRDNKLEAGKGLSHFLHQYFKDNHRHYFEENIITFFASYNQYKDFYESNIGRDQFMGIERTRVLYARHFYNNMQFLSVYLGMDWDLKNFAEYEKISVSRYGDAYDLYEEQLDEIVTLLYAKMIPISLTLRELITDTEFSYWINVDIKLLNFVTNIRDDGTFNDW